MMKEGKLRGLQHYYLKLYNRDGVPAVAEKLALVDLLLALRADIERGKAALDKETVTHLKDMFGISWEEARTTLFESGGELIIAITTLTKKGLA